MLRRPWLKSWKLRWFPSRSVVRRRVPLGLSLCRSVDVARDCSHPFVESLENRTLLAAITWDGGGDGTHWSDRLNWSTDVLPSTG